MQDMANRLKQRLGEGAISFGPNLQIPSPFLVEIIAGAGFDYVLLDGEHGEAFGDLPGLIIAADGAGISPIVRVPSHERAQLIRPLELGAAGVQVPMVDTAAQARVLVNETKYAPLGTRGFSGVARSSRFGLTKPEEIAQVGNDRVLLIVQIESAEGIANAAAIAAVPGVDMIFIGPSDLAQSLGVPGRPEAEEVAKAMRQVVHDVDGVVPVATVAMNRDDVEMWAPLGIRCFLTSSINPIRHALEALAADLNRGWSE